MRRSNLLHWVQKMLTVCWQKGGIDREAESATRVQLMCLQNAVKDLFLKVGVSLMTPWVLTLRHDTNHAHTHTHTQIQTGTSQGNIIMTGVKPCFPHVSSATFLCAHLRKTDVWETLCVSVAGSHVAAPTQVLRLWSDPRSARWGVHSCLSKVPVSQPWAITLVSLSSKIVKTGRFWVRGERRDQHTLERREN